MASEALTHNDYTVGWVCALPKEQTAAIAMLDQKHADLLKPPNDHNTYTLGCIGKHNIVIACLPKGRVGNESSATIATRMISTFPSIKFGLMVGIGGGVPPKVRLGDIVVSTPTAEYPGVVQWDFGKAEQDGNFKRTGALNNPPGALLTALTKLESEHEMNGSMVPQYLEDLKVNWPRLAAKYTRSESLEDILYRADYNHVTKKPMHSRIVAGSVVEDGNNEDWEDGDEEEKSCPFCDRTKTVKRRPREMLVHYGLIASGNQVIKDAAFRDKVNKGLGGNILCFEMEAAGLMNDFPCLVIRGICDYADSHKNKDWQEYAAAVAAAFAKEVLSVVQAPEVDQMPMIKILADVRESVTKMSRGLDNIIRRQDDQQVLNWLNSLNPINSLPSTDYYYGQQSDFIERRQEGTGEWLLKSSKFQDWVNQNKETLFCPGIPGAGKTIITSIVVDHLLRKFHDDAGVGIAYLYCNFRLQQEQRPRDLLTSLLTQLVQGQLSIPESVESLYESHKGKKTFPSFDEVSMVLSSILTGYPKVFIIIDALDECKASDGDRAKFLFEIFKLQAKTRASLFATSRFLPDIKEEFERRESILLDIRASEEDVRRYLDGHSSQLPKFVLRSPELKEEIETAIIKAADGMFLLARLHLDSLEDKISPKQIEDALEKLPKGSDAYSQAYKEAVERIRNQKTGFRDLAIRVLSWITCSKRPLATLELRHALAITDGASVLDERNLTETGLMVSVCAGLVTIDEESDIIRLVHYTTQEYFEQTQSDLFPCAQRDITTTCITYLSFDVFETGFCPTDKEFEARLQQNPLYDYAARNWGHHACKALMEVEQLILGFLESEAKISGSSQAMMASRGHSDYSQNVPRQITGVHLAAYFGQAEVIMALLKDRQHPDVENSWGQTPLSWAAENGHEDVVKLLLVKGADPNFNAQLVRTPLWQAAENGHEAVVKLLLEKGADPDLKGSYSQTPLWRAAGNGHEAVVKLLLEKGVELEYKDEYEGRTSLSSAALNGHEAVVKLLLEKGTELESKDKDGGRTPLSLAASTGHEAVVKLLLEKGAELESKGDGWGRTPLSWAAGRGHKVIVKLLLDKGAELESKDDDGGRTPLSWAAGHGHEPVVKLLLDKGAETGSKDDEEGGRLLSRAARKWSVEDDGVTLYTSLSWGWTPLSWAARGGHEGVVKLLLDKGVKTESKDDEGGQTPLTWAARRGHKAIVKLLLKKGADTESKDGHWDRTPLWWAVREGHEAVVKLLLNKGAKTESKDYSTGETPLILAARRGHEAVVKLLLDNGTDTESKDGRKLLIDVDAETKSIDWGDQTPLSWAAENGHEAVVKLLLDKGAETRSIDLSGQTPLSRAAENGHEAIVKLLLDKGAETELKDGGGRTPLSWAAQGGHEAVVKLLLNKSTDTESKDGGGRTPLSWAAQGGHEAIVKLLLSKSAKTGSKDDKGDGTSLLWAARGGHKEIVKLLLNKGVDTESKDDRGRTPLSCASQMGHEAIVKLLLNKGAKAESKDDKGDGTPLLWAARRGNEAIVKSLLDKGADIESKNNEWGLTPLSWAAQKGHKAIVELLLDKGADTESKDGGGRTPLSWAAWKGYEAIVKLLLNKGAETESKKGNGGRTPLSWAAGRGHEVVVKLLLDKGAEMESKKGNGGRTPLSWAAGGGHKAVVKLLLDKGAEMESKDDEWGQTPLSWAAGGGHEAVVKLLLDKGAETESKDIEGWMPLSLAAQGGHRGGHEAVVKLLLEKGTDNSRM